MVKTAVQNLRDHLRKTWQTTAFSIVPALFDTLFRHR